MKKTQDTAQKKSKKQRVSKLIAHVSQFLEQHPRKQLSDQDEPPVKLVQSQGYSTCT